MQAGEDPNRGFWETKPDGSKILNSRAGRGRVSKEKEKGERREKGRRKREEKDTRQRGEEKRN
jgi:hypothetical protein